MKLIRHLKENEWPLLKELRLKALLSDPDAFSGSFDEANAFPDAYWISITKNAENRESSKVFILENKGNIFGLVFGIRKDNECRLGGLWVDPKYRKQYLGAMLVDHVKNWTNQFKNIEYLKLWTINGKLEYFYRECGFYSTKNIKKHPVKDFDLIEMAWRNNSYS